MLFVCSCEPLSLNYSIGSSRYSHQSPRAISDIRGGSSALPDGKDRYFYTTVSFPPDYDWRQDSLYGAVQASINLFCGDSLVMQVPTGSLACPDADMHHFIGGHLYTLFRSSGRTVLARDGEVCLQLDREAILTGLLPLDGKLYTLWTNRGGEGFFLMEGSNERFSRSKGQPTGGMGLGACIPYGALYPDVGKACFCYRSGNDWFLVRDNEETPIRKPYWPVWDIRSIDGQICIYYQGDNSASGNLQYGESVINFKPSQYLFLKPGYIYCTQEEPLCVSAAYKNSDPDGQYTLLGFISGKSTALPGRVICRISSKPLYLLMSLPDGTTGYYSESSGTKYLQGRYYHISPCEGIRLNGKLHIILNPLEQGGKPGIWIDGELKELDFNGYITGIYQSSQ